MAGISMEPVTKSYRGAPAVVENIDIEVADGEFLVLVGPSGSGKSTLLRMIAGLEEITGGAIKVGDRVVNDMPPRDRDLAMVFQNYALYPHMTVAENMAFALKLKGVSKADRAARVANAAELLGLEPYLQRKPSELSGGQRQRVAMGRSIVREPKAFLMDEPLSNLDAKLRVAMRGVLSALHSRLGVTTVYVTHDQIEAMTLGDRVAVLADGKLQQVDTPQELFDAPANLFVAGFIGSPAMNMVEAELSADGTSVSFGSMQLAVPVDIASRVADLSPYAGKRVVLGVRPSSFVAGPDANPAAVVSGKVHAVEELGSEVNAIFTIDAPLVLSEHVGALAAEDTSEEQTLAVEAGHSLWTAKLPSGTRVKSGEEIKLGVDVARLHFFDLATGLAVGRPTHG